MADPRGCQPASWFYQIEGGVPAGMESVDRRLLGNRVSPPVPVNDFARAPDIPALQAEFLEGAGTWRWRAAPRLLIGSGRRGRAGTGRWDLSRFAH
jgi:hypothetical protein